MQRQRNLIAGAYLVGIALVLVPLLDAAISVLPFRADDVRWRFGVVGVLANALLIPNAGLLLVLTIATLAGHTTVRRTVGVVAAVAGAVCVFAIALFSLDAIQARATVRAGMGVPFAVATLSAMAKLLLSTITLVVLALAGLRAASTPAADDRPSTLPLIPSR